MMYECTFNLKAADIIFGIPNAQNIEMFNSLNFCILFAKQYIKKCHKENTECDIETYKWGLKQRLEVEKCILYEKPIEFLAKWSIVYNDVNDDY